ncbi:MAG: hypothetical protein AB7O91_08670 [Sphingomonas sp.]
MIPLLIKDEKSPAAVARDGTRPQVVPAAYCAGSAVTIVSSQRF